MGDPSKIYRIDIYCPIRRDLCRRDCILYGKSQAAEWCRIESIDASLITIKTALQDICKRLPYRE